MVNTTLLLNSLPSLIMGAMVSLQIALAAVVIGSTGGTLLALLMFYGNRVTKIIAHTYITIIRGTPMLVQILMLYFVLPVFGISIPAFWTAVIAIGLNSIAYMSQTIRAGIQAVGKGQIEAAQTLGFSRIQIARLIILPQALRTVLPALGNECITLIKDSSLASVIGVSELTQQGSIIMSKTYDALTVYLGVALIYLCMTSLVSLLLHLFEQRNSYVKN
jgi:His/Glu/Gln/Arg/opine family amino acid ABC transporter permease subunit